MKRGWTVAMVALALVLGVAAQPLLAPWYATSQAAEQKSGGAFSAAQKDEVRKLVREYLLEHPEVVVDAINVLQAKEDKAKDEKQNAALGKHKAALFEETDGTVLGNPKGDVTVVEFFDYNCGYCKVMFTAMMDALKEDGQVRLVLKEFPILGNTSVSASRAALAARKQNKYKELHLALLGHKGSLSDDVIMRLAKDVGLDTEKLTKDMNDPQVAAIINKNRALAQDLQINGTPAIVIGDTVAPGAISKAELLEMIKQARKKA